MKNSKPGPNAPLWRKLRSLEDILGTLASIDTRRKTLKRQIWRGASIIEIYKEIERMKSDIAALRELWGHWWETYKSEIQQGDEYGQN